MSKLALLVVLYAQQTVLLAFLLHFSLVCSTGAVTFPQAQYFDDNYGSKPKNMWEHKYNVQPADTKMSGARVPEMKEKKSRLWIFFNVNLGDGYLHHTTAVSGIIRTEHSGPPRTPITNTATAVVAAAARSVGFISFFVAVV